MIEVFLAICAFTTLECNDITVAFYSDFDEDTYGAAGYDLQGNYYILINPDSAKKSENFQRQLMVHEIAHLLAFEQDINAVSHYGIYEGICEELQERTGVKGSTVCKPYHIKPHYPWRATRRE